ncbi:unnamed protein product [Lymnaea stagnalis]|uniref:Uncharacterized protein n=1 Tax=Lymnaea stagnalis TaxID=6523 RepID=A0AAV2HJW6_LYMST
MNAQLVALLLATVLQSGTGTKFFLTVPKIPSYDAKFTAVVTAFQHSSGQQLSVQLAYKGFVDSSKVIHSTTLLFDRDGTQNWTVIFPWEHMQDLNETMVTLSMTSDNQKTEKVLTFRPSSGYIFIQTDKPVYTPTQTVKFRVIAVDEEQKLAKYHLKVDIRNKDNITLDRMRYSAEDAFKGQEFELPRETPLGFYYISANFEGLDNKFSLAHNVSFEVREYVLPRFYADLRINSSVITNDTKDIKLTIRAKYVYGRPVIGRVEVKLGRWNYNKVELFPNAHYVEELRDGVLEKNISVLSLIPNPLRYDDDRRLYVYVNVTEGATLENYTIVDTSTYISHPYYVVDFTSSKKYFKPGFPYTLQANIKTKTGVLASWAHLNLTVWYMDELGKELQGGLNFLINMDKAGKAVKELATPAAAFRIRMNAFVQDSDHPTYWKYNFTVSLFESPSKDYLHISVPAPVKKTNDGMIWLRYSNTSNNDGSDAPLEQITVLVLARGHVIFTSSITKSNQGVSLMALPKKLFHELSPSYRIIAYFNVRNLPSGMVTDSLQVAMPNNCMEEVFLFRPGGMFAAKIPNKPKDKYDLHVWGGPNMRVGFVAVDKAIYLLSDKRTLTRSLMFEQLGSHDQGTNSGDGRVWHGVLEHSGLWYMMIDTSLNVYEPTFLPTRVLSSYPTLLPRWPSLTRGRMGPEGPTMGKEMTKAEILYDEPIRKNSRSPPPQTIRNYFPESWFFEERILPQSGRMDLNLTLPDSITTWSFLAVGLSANRGICVSDPLEQEVQKLFFADVIMPYKATRLEEIKIKVAVYNYHEYQIKVNATIYGEKGICFSDNADRSNQQNSYKFSMTIEKEQSASETIKVVPLNIGDLKLKVDVISQNERDVVEKQLHVIAEGLRIRKMITFVLDPEAKHVSFAQQIKNKNVIQIAKTATIVNTFNQIKRQQHTRIDLAMPAEVIKGTEFCRIAAFGDLMGDILNHAVVKSKSLMDQPIQTAEEVLSDMGPTVHALNYINATGLMDADLRERGRRFVRHAITRLLKYRQGPAFSLKPNSKPATWLTALVLKTLCHATNLAFVDKKNLIDDGFSWLQSQVYRNGTLREQDWRLSQSSFEHKVMLSAEVLIALIECNRFEKEDHLTLQGDMAMFLERYFKRVKQRVVMAKLAYALHLSAPNTKTTLAAIERLKKSLTKNNQKQIFWADNNKGNELKKVPEWFRQESSASSIEATAYGLLVFMDNKGVNEDAIGDWLVTKRKNNGAFIGALDSTAAIQALTKYSLKKQNQGNFHVNMNCNVSSDKNKRHKHFFKFTHQNATRPESLSDIPVGHILEVTTEGQGLGQMQIIVAYNIPIDKNANCSYKVTVDTKPSIYNVDKSVCAQCSFGCPIRDLKTRDVNYLLDPFYKITARTSTNPVNETNITVRKTHKGKQHETKRRKIRSSYQTTYSHKIYCIHICLRHVARVSGEVNVHVEMLTGFTPMEEDVESLKYVTNVTNVEMMKETDTLLVTFSQINVDKPTCFGFRARENGSAERINPAIVTVTEAEHSEPACSLEYHPPPGRESLKVYCADFHHINRGECKCFSGKCSYCGPKVKDEFSLQNTTDLTCKSKIAYQVQLHKIEDRIHWLEVDAKVHTINKTGIHKPKPGELIKMHSPSSCFCLNDYGLETFYMFSPDAERLVSRNGKIVHRYLLDENTTFLRVDSPLIFGPQSSTKPPITNSSTTPSTYTAHTVPHNYFVHAFNEKNCSLRET